MSAPGDGDHPLVTAPPLVTSEGALIAVCLPVTPAQGVVDPGTSAGGSAGGCTGGLCCSSSFRSQDIHLVLADCSSSPLAPSLASDSRKYIQNGLKA